jgi:ABC-2 type transport system ATP-binding protein
MKGYKVPGEGTAAVHLEGVSKSFGKKQVLEEITFSVEKGDLFGFLGPNGAGKTTTMRIILGLLEPDRGTALVFGDRFGDSAVLRLRAGVVLDEHGLYEDMTLGKNLGFYCSLYGISRPKERTAELLAAVGLAGEEDRKVGEFSSGMEKRAALARALVNDPQILFLDEPTAGLDPEAQIGFRGVLSRLSEERGVTVFLNSHNLDEVQKICSRVGVINRGRIEVCDTVASLQARYSEPTVMFSVYSEEDGRELSERLRGNRKIGRIERDGTKIVCILLDEDFRLRELLEYGIEIREFAVQQKTLEEVYMDILGRKEEI